jgi:hypothetical protein
VLYPQCPKITNASKLRFRALLAERYATGRVALVVWFFAASIVAALGGMESVLAEMHRGDPDKPPRSAFWPMPLRPV